MNPFCVLVASTSWLDPLSAQLGFEELDFLPFEGVESLEIPDTCQYALIIGREHLEPVSRITQLLDRMDPLQLRVIFLGSLAEWLDAGLPAGVLHALLGQDSSMEEVAISLRSLYELHVAGETVTTLESCIERYSGDLDQILTIGKQLTAEKDHTALLRLMLGKSMDLTGADAGSIFLVEDDESSGRCLRFAYTDTRSLVHHRRFEAFTMPLSKKSVAGYVALTGNPLLIEDVYLLEEKLEYAFDPSYDKNEGYRTKSMLVVPLVNHKGESLGAIQLINAKEDGRLRATDLRELEAMILPFTVAHKDVIMAIAGQAAVAIENNRLVQSIERLFEGFVEASVTAIESRDPTTSGHSFRVAQLTVELARCADQATEGPWANMSLSANNLKEIRYASILHDFGKVGVREEVLTKPKKLFKWQLTELLNRFEWLKKDHELRHLRRKLEVLERGGATLEDWDKELAKEILHLDGWMEVVRQANEPSLLDSNAPATLEEISRFRYRDAANVECALLSDDERRILSIKRGSLSDEEWVEMRSHVNHTYEFLRRIPWTKDLSRVPEIAWAHHEYLDGSGYTRGLGSGEIPYGSRMMTICDIYDAITAKDRPYKKAAPHGVAIDILHKEAENSRVDASLLDMFVQRKVFEVIQKDKDSSS